VAGAHPPVEVSPGLVGGFTRWAEAAGATVERVDDEEGARAAIRSLAERLSARRLTATRDAASFAPAEAIQGGSFPDVADADLGVSLARLGVAETGSVLLGWNQIDDRLVGLLALNHAVVLPIDRLVASLDEALVEVRRLSAPGPERLRYLQLVSGPSRSGDIERVLAVGVQGPRALHVIVVGDTR